MIDALAPFEIIDAQEFIDIQKQTEIANVNWKWKIQHLLPAPLPASEKN
jgi:hypothetical protein